MKILTKIFICIVLLSGILAGIFIASLEDYSDAKYEESPFDFSGQYKRTTAKSRLEKEFNKGWRELSDEERIMYQNISKGYSFIPDTLPDYYGGCYSNKRGELIVMITEGFGSRLFVTPKEKLAREEIIRITQYDSIIFRKVDYSLKNLIESCEKLYKLKYRYMNDINRFSYALEEANNRIAIWMRPYEEDNIRWLNENIKNEPYFVYKDGKEITVAVATE